MSIWSAQKGRSVLTLEIGGYLLTAILSGLFSLLVIQWWKFRSGARR
jgi:hypothetical protein